jgi:predicted esterase
VNWDGVGTFACITARTALTTVIGVIGMSVLGTPPIAAQSVDDSFGDALERLRLGSVRAEQVPTGRVERTRANEDGLLHRYVLIIPEDYDPTKRYPVAFYLHGGVSRPDPGPGGGWWRNYDNVIGHDRIAVLPLSWNESYWWQASQVENLRGILSDVKRTYNVDENRVYAFGSSDGATGVYFLGFRDVTAWAAFLPFIGHPGVLMSPQTGVDGQMNVANLTNRSFFIVNGETDPLYPVRSVMPFLDAFEREGVDFVFTAKPSGHSTSWWPEEEDNIEGFVEAHVRDPHPERVHWATERTDRYNRAHWVVIDELGPTAGDDDRPPPVSLLPIGPAGSVDAVRSGNTVTVDTYHVRRFTLLISPDVFDLESPIRVVTNGDVVFEEMVRPDPATLMKWAAVDEDRTMLYAAEINVELPAAP